MDQISLNIIITLICSFIITVGLMPFFIKQLYKLKFGQSIREDGPQSHLKKAGTPTMGGIVFIIATLLTMIIVNSEYLLTTKGLMISVVFLAYFLIGLYDDLLIVIKKKNDGVSVKMKLLLQCLVVVVLVIISSDVILDPQMGIVNFFGYGVNLGYFYLIFILIMFVAYSNAVNLTDGLDGLSSITMVIALIFMAIIAFVQQQNIELMYIVALIGGLLGFFVFNKKPARIFMGDTGSLALGGFYAIIALLLKVEILSIVIGIVFVLETLSVVIQVLYYKKTKKRFFRMAPLHHHFELGKLKETKSVLLFYLIGLCGGIIGMVIYFV